MLRDASLRLGDPVLQKDLAGRLEALGKPKSPRELSRYEEVDMIYCKYPIYNIYAHHIHHIHMQ